MIYVIELREITKEYKMGKNKVTALYNINRNIKKGEFLGITGNSGSGKTTLSNIIAGLLRPTKGQVVINGQDIWSVKDRELSRFRNKTLGFVFQSFNLIPGLTALENVILPLAYSKIKRKDRIIMAKNALETVGLSDRIYHKPSELSGGQMQRVSIARAIINSPEIIIADEPTGNLDEKTSENIMNLLREINKKGVTVLTVTHNLNHKKYFTDVMEIRDGRVV